MTSFAIVIQYITLLVTLAVTVTRHRVSLHPVVFLCSPLPKMPRQPAAGTSLRVVPLRQEGLRGEVVHPAGSGERRAGPLH